MQQSFLYPKEQKTYIVLDTETTGLSPYQGDAIIEIAAVKIDEQGNELDHFEHFINPRIPISPGAQIVHGLDDAFISKNGRPLEDIIPKFAAFTGSGILVGHNIIKFDIVFINKHLHDINHDPLENDVIDTLHLSREKLKLPNYKLGTVAQNFDIPYVNAHRAMNDVMINKDVFLKLMGM